MRNLRAGFESAGRSEFGSADELLEAAVIRVRIVEAAQRISGTIEYDAADYLAAENEVLSRLPAAECAFYQRLMIRLEDGGVARKLFCEGCLHGSRDCVCGLEEGRRLRDEGKALVAEGNASFLDVIRAVARDIARDTGSVSANDLRAYALEHGLAPDHPNAWGAVFKGGEWRALGYVQSSIPSRHAGMIREWALKGVPSFLMPGRAKNRDELLSAARGRG